MAMLGRLGGVALVAAAVLVSFSPVPPEKLPLMPPEKREGSPISIHGPAGGLGVLEDSLPSGQAVGKVPTETLTFASGRRAGRSVVAEDGSVLMTGASHNDAGRDGEVATSGEMVIGVYPPGGSRLQSIRLRTKDGRESIVDSRDFEVAPTVTDLLPLPGGTVAFAAVTTGFGDGWPVFGVLAPTGGQWGVAWSVTGVDGGDPPNRLARLKGSGDIVATSLAGSVSVLRLTGDRLRVIARHRLDGGTPNQVRTDPTGVPGDERFVVGLGTRVQEWRYDSRAGTIAALSPPVLPGDKTKDGKPYGFGPALYDHAGNLWIARTTGGSLAVYARRLCDCPPDYDVLQARALGEPVDLVEDTATGTIAALFGGGVLFAARATGSGRQMRFETGNPVDLGHKLLTLNENGWLVSRLAEGGPPGRLWIPTGRMTSRDGRPAIDHLMIAVRLEELFSPAPVLLPSVPAHEAIIQAERTITTATRQAAAARTISVDSSAYVTRCLDVYGFFSGCEYDQTAGNGFYVHHSAGFGFLGGFVEYRVRVPSDGRYTVTYRVSTFGNTPDTQVRMSVGGRTYDTPVFRKGGGWHVVRAAEPIHLTAGEHTIRLGVAEKHEGWFLNSFSLHRL